MNESIQKIIDISAIYGLKILASLAILIFGKIAISIIKSIITKILTKNKIDPTLSKFILNVLNVLLFAFVIIAALGQLGIQTTSFVAIIGAAGLAVGLALQGSLSNFAAGVLMIIFRPFKVTDFVEGAGISGVVTEIGIFTTTLKSTDNKKIIVPNSQITAGNIINYSAHDTRRLDLVIGVGYGDDLKKVKTVLKDIVDSDSRILKDPGVTIGVVELGDSSVNLVLRPWVKTSDYWDVHFDLLETVKIRFDSEGINIPYPQQDIHIIQK